MMLTVPRLWTFASLEIAWTGLLSLPSYILMPQAQPAIMSWVDWEKDGRTHHGGKDVRCPEPKIKEVISGYVVKEF